MSRFNSFTVKENLKNPEDILFFLEFFISNFDIYVCLYQICCWTDVKPVFFKKKRSNKK